MDRNKRSAVNCDSEMRQCGPTSARIERHPIEEPKDYPGPPPYSAGAQLDMQSWGPGYNQHEDYGVGFGQYEWMQRSAPGPLQSGILPERRYTYHASYHQPHPNPYFAAPYPQYENERCLSPGSWNQRNGNEELAPRIKPSKSGRMQFPEKLMHALVHFPNEEAVTWTPYGDCFMVLNPDLFVTEILSKVSKTTIKYPSVVRKLLRWGFTRLPSRSNKGCFHHPYFNIYSPEQASLVTAVNGTLSARKVASSSSETCTPFRSHPPRIEGTSITNNHGHESWIESISHAKSSQVQSLPQSSSVHSTSKTALPTSRVVPTGQTSTYALVRSQDYGDQLNTPIGLTNCQSMDKSDPSQAFADQGFCYPRAEDKSFNDTQSDKDTDSPLAFAPLQYRSAQGPSDDGCICGIPADAFSHSKIQNQIRWETPNMVLKSGRSERHCNRRHDQTTPTWYTMQTAQVYDGAVLEVTAPSDMAGDYEFIAKAGDGLQYTVRVPEGGVIEGQQFQAIIVRQVPNGTHSIPHGQWRDGLCSCSSTCTTIHCCMGLWLPAVLLGQVLTRLQWNCCAQQQSGSNNNNGAKRTVLSSFKVLAGVTLLWYLGAAVYQIVYYEYGETTSSAYSDSFAYGEHTATLGLTENATVPIWIVYIVASIITYGLTLLVVLVTCRTRQQLRDTYGIPAGACGRIEDVCCAVVCGPCTVCQMARHTADYDVYPAACCTETGLGADAPMIV